jgi:hypothetical protein
VKLSRIAAVARQLGEAPVGYGADAFLPSSRIPFWEAPSLAVIELSWRAQTFSQQWSNGVFQVPLKLLTGVSPEVALDSDERMVAALQQLIRGTLYALNHIHGEISRQHTKAKHY